MGRLCAGAHEISDIKAPLFLHGGWVVVGWWLVGWVVRVRGGGVVGSGWVGDVMGSGWGGGVHDWKDNFCS